MESRVEPTKEVDDLANTVIGAAIEVHKQLGPGYLESVYEQALAVELGLRGIPYVRQHQVSVAYKDTSVGEGRLDFLVAGKLIVELKAVEGILPIHKSQLISYLKAMSLPLGLLINFNVRMMRDGIQRVVFSPQ
ncbi:MAG: GxxExxY protein [Candidatus Muproteobacteria bacterium RBG_16_64_11]|uniref:GxxExxY protein n=1 Tax=Candidatus Muproteobacteria bacterium RBG_16_64_11 TaxID=1817758 RepID=A0A1F6THI4_9PROT|nr:MAG: GxxExxY protein [Candidatus Muproteobacteria bacterium RBG_16_64_11]